MWKYKSFQVLVEGGFLVINLAKLCYFGGKVLP